MTKKSGVCTLWLSAVLIVSFGFDKCMSSCKLPIKAMHILISNMATQKSNCFTLCTLWARFALMSMPSKIFVTWFGGKWGKLHPSQVVFLCLAEKHRFWARARKCCLFGAFSIGWREGWGLGNQTQEKTQKAQASLISENGSSYWLVRFQPLGRLV